jgi:cell cycle sensor histidine kinase DivJ
MATLADNLNPAQVREYAGLIHQGGANLLRLVNQIMDLTKLAAGRYDLRRGPLDAGRTLRRAAEPFEGRANARGIALETDACPSGLMLDADESVVMAMAGHLLDNAVAFTQPGGHVRLSVRREAEMIVFAIADDGPGVSSADIARILRPFEQAGAVTQHAEGSGLGLTLVKAFAELHGGTLAIASAPGEGFTATVTLPVAG